MTCEDGGTRVDRGLRLLEGDGHVLCVVCVILRRLDGAEESLFNIGRHKILPLRIVLCYEFNLL